MLQRAAKRFDSEALACFAVLGVVALVGLVTARDYGITIDEFNTELYGQRALDWYLSGFSDRAVFAYEEMALYGPWAQILIAAVQRLHLALLLTTRHAVNFLIGLAGLAALYPLARLAIGRWAGLIATVLCLITGYIYGQLFNTPIDVPFLAAMTWATLAIVVMTRRAMPTWRATIVTGLAIGLALATRTGGIIAFVYLYGALGLCAFEIALRQKNVGAMLLGLALRFFAAVAISCAVTYALWPWLQNGNPLTQYDRAYSHFAQIRLPIRFPSWGRELSTDNLPWHYVSEQLLARLPELFVVLLLVAFAAGLIQLVRVARLLPRWRVALLEITQARSILVVLVAALGPPLLLVIKGMDHYDGIRHVLFIIPMLALLAAWGALQIAPWLMRWPRITAAVAGAQVAISLFVMIALHPFEYVATNAFAGSTWWSHGRFELDYWTAAGEEAVRRLARTLPPDAKPRVITCVPWREHEMWRIYPPQWIVETDRGDADYLIETERYRCAQPPEYPHAAILIDEVQRFGRTFAWTYKRNQ